MNIKNLSQAVGVLFILSIYFYHSDVIVSAVKDALFLCYNTVIPSLFLFMIISSYISGLKSAGLLSLPFVPFFRILNITDRRIMTYCILSILGGFATGGIFLDRISQEYTADKNLFKILPLIVSGNSPAFVIIGVGLQFTGSMGSGVLLYLSILLSSYITAFIFSFIFPYSSVQYTNSNELIPITITDAVKTSVTGIINICGTVILAYTVCKVINIYTENLLISWAVSAFYEVTTSCSFINNHLQSNIYLYCISLCVFPLSALLQMKSFDRNNTIDFKVLILSKFFQVPLAICVLRILVNLFPVTASVYASSDIKVNMYWNTPYISCYLFILSICFVVLFDKKIGVFTKLRK